MPKMVIEALWRPWAMSSQTLCFRWCSRCRGYFRFSYTTSGMAFISRLAGGSVETMNINKVTAPLYQSTILRKLGRQEIIMFHKFYIYKVQWFKITQNINLKHSNNTKSSCTLIYYADDSGNYIGRSVVGNKHIATLFNTHLNLAAYYPT